MLTIRAPQLSAIVSVYRTSGGRQKRRPFGLAANNRHPESWSDGWRLRTASVPDMIHYMARCTAPREGHRSASAAANCPACRGRSRYGYGYSSGYSSQSYSSPSYYPSSGSGVGGRSSGGTGRVRASWSKPGSSVFYTSAEVRELSPVRANVEDLAVKRPDLRDVFLCHAWDDRQKSAKGIERFSRGTRYPGLV